MALKKHGITTETVSNMVLGAGVIYKNLAYASSEWTGEVIGATSGGITFHHEINWLEIEVDGATVLVKGVSRQKVGEAAYLEGQLTEVTPFALTKAMHLVEAGKNLIYIRDFLGHESIETTQVYAKANPEARRKALETMDRKMKTPNMPDWNDDPDLKAFLKGL